MFQGSDKFNADLTNYAQGIYLNPGEDLDLMALFFPAVGVDEQTGSYDVYDPDSALSAVNATLPRDNSPRRIQLNRTQKNFNCQPYALEIATWAPALLQKSAPTIRLDATRTLMSAQFATRQVQAVDLVKNGVATCTFNSGIAGDWSNSATNVLAQLDAMCGQVVHATGKKPTHIVMGHAAWDLLRNHQQLQGRFHALDYALREDALLSMLSYRGVKLTVCEAMAKVDGTMTALLDHDVIVMHQEAAPSRTDLSMGKEFTLSPNGPEVISYKDHGIYDVDMLMWSSDPQVTNPAAATRIVVA